MMSNFLFKNCNEDIVNDLLHNHSLEKEFKKNAYIAFEGDICTSIGIVIKGQVQIQKVYPSGKTIVVAHLNTDDIFGEVIVFSDIKKYPSTIFCFEDCKILFLSKEILLKFFEKEPNILYNFMNLLSNKVFMLNQKVRNLSYDTIREKISNFLIEEYYKQKTVFIKLSMSKKHLAEIFAIPRPSLSRELINMKNEGLIDYDRNFIKILDIKAIENQLF